MKILMRNLDPKRLAHVEAIVLSMTQEERITRGLSADPAVPGLRT